MSPLEKYKKFHLAFISYTPLTMWGLVTEWTVLEEAAIGRENTHQNNNDQDHHQRHPGQDQQLVPNVQADQLLRHLVNSRVRTGVVLILAGRHVGSICKC